MQSLIATIRRKRLVKITVGRYVFTGTRPTDVEAMAIYRSGLSPLELAARVCADHVTDWALVDGPVTENEVVGDGGDMPVKFDRALWQEWIADKRDLWPPISNAILDAYEEHTKSLDDAVKNSAPA